MKPSRVWVGLLAIGVLAIVAILAFAPNPNPFRTLDAPLDSLDGVVVYYNGRVGRTAGRTVAQDGYNLGLKHQCVEFVKRYYHETYRHEMPNSHGHAKDFFDLDLKDGDFNGQRGLFQCQNPSRRCPAKGDLVVWAPTRLNPYGHVAIVSQVEGQQVEIIQQNPGPWGSSRKRMPLEKRDGKYGLPVQVLGWLHVKDQ